MTTGRGPVAPGGKPRPGGRDQRQPKRPGETGGPGEEVADIGAICRTEAILDALAARRATPNTQENCGPPENRHAPRTPASVGDDVVLSALAALAADVDERAGRPDQWCPGGTFARRIHTGHGAGEPPGVPISARGRLIAAAAGPRRGRRDEHTGTMLASLRRGMRHAVTVAAAAAVLVTCGLTAAAMHGRLSWLVITSRPAAGAAQQDGGGAPGATAGGARATSGVRPAAAAPAMKDGAPARRGAASPVAGGPASGRSAPGEPVAGGPAAGGLASGGPVAGGTAPGGPVAGRPAAGGMVASGPAQAVGSGGPDSAQAAAPGRADGTGPRVPAAAAPARPGTSPSGPAQGERISAGSDGPAANSPAASGPAAHPSGPAAHPSGPAANSASKRVFVPGLRRADPGAGDRAVGKSAAKAANPAA